MFRVRRSKLTLLALAVGPALPTIGFGQTSNWTHSDSVAWSASWTVPSNWNPNANYPNGGTANVVFPAAAVASASGTVLLDQTVSAQQLNFQENAGNNYTINGTGTVSMTTVGTIDVAANAIGTVGLKLTLPSLGTLYKTGLGTLVLNGANDWGGGAISVDGGNLVAKSAAALGNAAAVSASNGAAFILDNASGITASMGGGLGGNAVGGTLRSTQGNSSITGTWFVLATNSSIGVDAGTLTINKDTGFDTAITDAIAPENFGISKEGAGMLRVDNLRLEGSMTVNAGTLHILQNGGAAGVSKVRGLSVAPGAALDLRDNDLIIDYTGPSPAADIKAKIASGRNGGLWNAAGITSSRAAISPSGGELKKTALGWAEATAIGSPTSWLGQSVDSTTIIVKYTYSADANLDGSVDLSDANAWLAGYSGPGATTRVWRQGDWNYDGAVDLSDANLWLASYTGPLGGGGLGDFEAGLAIFNSVLVPEPSILGLAGVGLTSLLARRRSRNRRV